MATILVVDDRPTNRELLLTVLGYAGHRLLEAADGAAALDLARSEHPDLVITDILMPTMDGYELAFNMRKEPDLAGTCIVFYTATYSSPEARLLADSCGVSTVLRKPAEPSEILATVDRELGAKARQHPAAPGTATPKPQRAGDQAGEYLDDLRTARAILDEVLSASPMAAPDRERAREISEKLSSHIGDLQRLTSRLTTLTEIAMDMMAEREPAHMIEKFFSAACRMIPSDCAAVGMYDLTERGLAHLFTKGIDPAIYDREARTGRPASLAREPRFLRLEESQLKAFPAGHPAMCAFLGGPIVHTDQAHGWLYFANTASGKPFSVEDERVAGTLGSMLALLHEHVMLYDTVQRHSAKLQIEMTGRKQAETAARNSEAKFRELIEQASDGIFVTDAQGNFKLVNPRFCEMLGYGEQELLRLDVSHTYVEAERSALADRLGTLGEVKSRIFERTMQRRDGSLFPVEVSIRRLSSGMNQGMVRDISERRKAAAALAESEFRFRQLAENITEVFWLTDPAKNEMLYISPAYEKIWGRSCEALYASPREWLDAIHPDDKQRVLEAAVAKQSRGDYDEEYRIVRPDGSIRWIRDQAFPVRDPGGRAYRIAGVAGDVTERKQAEFRILSLNRVYAVLSGINALIVRAKTREELYQEACRIAVEDGKFGMAWIGEIDRTTLDVTPVAWEGMQGEAAALRASARGDIPQGQGMVGRAIRGKQPVITNDIAADPGAGGPRRKEALERGFQSIIALPLMVDGEVKATLTLFARERNFFSQDEMKLLTELAGDISFALDHIEKADRLDYLAYYDATTGIANRKLLLERVDQRIRITAEKKGRLALAILDVERFKSINDTLGRHTGDQLLKVLAGRLAEFLGEPDRVGRVLGDQFGVVIPDVQSEDDVARRIDRKLKECIGAPVQLGGRDLRVSARAGIALYPEDGADADTLFRNAEAALKRAKAGGDRYLFYAQRMTERVGERLALENQLRLALEKEEFVLHYQPKVDTATRRIEGVEALIRWQSRELGLVPPMQFIPLLEETGLILEVGAWALRRAALDYRRWLAQGLNPPRIAVNVSAKQVRLADFAETTLDSIRQEGVRSAIDLEVTETLIMEDIEANIEKFEALRVSGMEIAIDDFGTGYSSLAYLAKLPVQLLKIDRSFINSMLKDPAIMTLVSTMVSLAHTLKLKVVAEGVETEEQAETLKRLGCDQLQGYLIGKPQPFDQVATLFGRRVAKRKR